MNKRKKNRGPGFPKILPALIAIGLVVVLVGALLDKNGWGALQAQAAQGLENVRISEVQNNNALTLPNGEKRGPAWIELENTGSEAISLKGLCLTRDTKLNKTLVFPDIDLGAGEYMLVYADGKNETDASGIIHAPFRLPRSGAHELYLYDDAQRLLDSVSLPVMKADESYCRNASGEWEVTAKPSPGAANTMAQQRGENVQAGDVTLNELVCANLALFPDESGEYDDYIEVLNTSDRPVDLEGYWLSDNPAKPNKWSFPSVTLPAGGVLAIHCSGEDRRDDPEHLHASFRLSKGETVYLAQPDGATVSVATLPDLRAGQALSRNRDGEWVIDLPPTPNRENTIDAAMTMDSDNRSARAGQVYISEVMAHPENEKSDWLELYNDSDVDVDLSGWGLSDKLNHARKWQFPAGSSIPAHDYLAVFLVGKGPAAKGNYLSATFALPTTGGCTVSLCDPSGAIKDVMYLPQQLSGISYGRDDGGNCGFLPRSTPLAPNGAGALLAPAEGARYSVPGGLHTTGDSFSVTLEAKPGTRIYYTLDCSDPSESKTLYDGTPIPVSGNTILRTRVYEDGHLPSFMDTQSYLFDVKAADQVPYVVSLVSDPTGLYSDKTGIMVKGPNAREQFPYGNYGKGANFWMDWEREAHVEVFTQTGETAISQECGIKLHGRNTRAYDLKSFKVMAKGIYGTSMFSYPLFEDRPWDEYEAFILRYSGQDYKYTFMRDAVLTKLASNTSVMYMERMESIVYLNGEYYSAMYVRENISPFSLARREGWIGQEHALDLVKSGNEVLQGSDESYLALKEYLKTHDNNTQEAYDAIDRVVDIDNFVDYITLYVVLCPPDTVNVKRYRNPDADGKWRWVLYDVDRGLRGGSKGTDGFKLMAQGTNAVLFKAFMNNDQLREKFLVNLNTALGSYLSSQNMRDAVESQYRRIQPLLPQYLDNVGVTEHRYENNIKNLLVNVKVRPGCVLKHCASYLDLSKEEMKRRFPDAYAAIEAYKG